MATQHKTGRLVLALMVGLSFGLAFAGDAAEALSNHDIINFAEANISPHLIVDKIRTSPNTFDLTESSVVALKRAGVADEVLAAMLMAATGGDLPPPPASNPIRASGASLQPPPLSGPDLMQLPPFDGPDSLQVPLSNSFSGLPSRTGGLDAFAPPPLGGAAQTPPPPGPAPTAQSRAAVPALAPAVAPATAGAAVDAARFQRELLNIASGEVEKQRTSMAWMMANQNQTMPLLRQILKEEVKRPEIQAASLYALGGMQDTGSLAEMRRLIGSPSPVVRHTAAKMLSNMGDVEAINAAEEMLSKPVDPLDGFIRLIGHARLVRAAENLGKILSTSSVTLNRAAAAWSLAEIGRAGAVAWPALEKALTKDADPVVRREAARAIAIYHEPDSAALLQSACRRDPEVRKITLNSLADYPEAVEFLISVMNLTADQIAADELDTARGSLFKLTGQDFGMDGSRWSRWYAQNKARFAPPAAGAAGLAGAASSALRPSGASPFGGPASPVAAAGRDAPKQVDVAHWGIVTDPAEIPMAPEVDRTPNLRRAGIAGLPGLTEGVRQALPRDPSALSLDDFSDGTGRPAAPRSDGGLPGPGGMMGSAGVGSIAAPRGSIAAPGGMGGGMPSSSGMGEGARLPLPGMSAPGAGGGSSFDSDSGMAGSIAHPGGLTGMGSVPVGSLAAPGAAIRPPVPAPMEQASSFDSSSYESPVGGMLDGSAYSGMNTPMGGSDSYYSTDSTYSTGLGDSWSATPADTHQTTSYGGDYYGGASLSSPGYVGDIFSGTSYGNSATYTDEVVTSTESTGDLVPSAALTVPMYTGEPPASPIVLPETYASPVVQGGLLDSYSEASPVPFDGDEYSSSEVSDGQYFDEAAPGTGFSTGTSLPLGGLIGEGASDDFSTVGENMIPAPPAGMPAAPRAPAKGGDYNILAFPGDDNSFGLGDYFADDGEYTSGGHEVEGSYESDFSEGNYDAGITAEGTFVPAQPGQVVQGGPLDYDFDDPNSSFGEAELPPPASKPAAPAATESSAPSMTITTQRGTRSRGRRSAPAQVPAEASEKVGKILSALSEIEDSIESEDAPPAASQRQNVVGQIGGTAAYAEDDGEYYIEAGDGDFESDSEEYGRYEGQFIPPAPPFGGATGSVVGTAETLPMLGENIAPLPIPSDITTFNDSGSFDSSYDFEEEVEDEEPPPARRRGSRRNEN